MNRRPPRSTPFPHPTPFRSGAKLTDLAQESPSPSAQAIIVRADSPIKTIADLKRKKIAVTKAAGVHYLLIATLEKAGLKFSDVDPAYLSPADGRAAFERGSVDAWVTWDPFLAGVQRPSQVRVLSDGTGLADYRPQERRVGNECRSQWAPSPSHKKPRLSLRHIYA